MPRAGLSPAALVTIGLAVVDEGGSRGFEDLTLAAVAGRAGVAVPSLYKHVGSLAALRRAIAVVCVNDLADTLTRATIGRSGSDAVRALAAAYRDHARRHPGRYAATQVASAHLEPVERSGVGPDRVEATTDALVDASARTVEVVAAVLAGCGVEPRSRIHAIRTLRAGLHGFVSLELAGGFGLPEDVDASFTFLVEVLDAGIRSSVRPAATPTRS
jgi:AcrR family transcriptional regulator